VSTTAELADFASQLTYDQLSPPVIEHVKLLILDGVGCGMYGSTRPNARIVRRVLRGDGGGNISVWGDETGLSLRNAIVANAYAIDCCDFDDVHKDAIIHAEPVLLPPLFALSGSGVADGTISGKEFIAAFAAGAEVGSRVGLAAGFSLLRAGFHAAGITGAFCSVAASVNLLRVAPEVSIDAIGAAGSLGSGLMSAGRGSQAKHLHVARSAEAGALATLLAGEGIRGTRNLLEADFGGFLSTYAPASDLTALTRGLGSTWACLGIGVKLFASGASTHCAIEAALLLRDEINLEAVDEIDVATTSLTYDHAGWRFDASEGSGSARLNIPWCVAVALVRGRVSVDDFSEEALADAELRALAAKVRVRPDVELDLLGPGARHACRVTARQRHDAPEVYVEVALGTEDRPLSREEVEGKFMDLVGRVAGVGRSGVLSDQIRSLEDVSDVNPVIEQLFDAALILDGPAR
jgi:aconitate decarboxylase